MRILHSALGQICLRRSCLEFPLTRRLSNMKTFVSKAGLRSLAERSSFLIRKTSVLCWEGFLILETQCFVVWKLDADQVKSYQSKTRYVRASIRSTKVR